MSGRRPGSIPVPRNPLRHQLPTWTPLGAGALLRSAFGLGARDPLRELRELLAADLGANAVVLTGSGTQALALALAVAGKGRRASGRSEGEAGAGAGVRRGDAKEARAPGAAPIALPAWSCYDLASAAVHHGAPVHFYDLDPRTLAPDRTSLESALEGGAKTVVVAPHFGVPTRMVQVEEVVHHFGARLVVDAAQGWGARFEGRPLAGAGELTVLSFGRGKGWTAGGGGGALVLRGREEPPPLAGVGPSPWAGALALLALGRPGIYRIPRSVPALGLGVTRYHPPSPPAPMRPATARLLLATREAAFVEARGRAARGAMMHDALRRSGGAAALVHPPEGSEAGWLRFPVLVPGGIEGLEARARRGRGTGPGPVRLGAAQGYPEILPELPALSGLVAPGVPQGPDAFPGARRLARDLVTLPTHSRVRSAEREALLALVAEVVGVGDDT